VTNVVAGLRSDEFFCSGALLRADVKEHPVTAGMPPQADLLFERNEVFDTKPGFRGTVLASYISNHNPLRSGYLIGPEKIEGKAAALDAVMGQGHVILIGFRTQWRGQSHGTYKLMFNAAVLQQFDGSGGDCYACGNAARRRRTGRRARARRECASGCSRK